MKNLLIIVLSLFISQIGYAQISSGSKSKNTPKKPLTKESTSSDYEMQRRVSGLDNEEIKKIGKASDLKGIEFETEIKFQTDSKHPLNLEENFEIINNILLVYSNFLTKGYVFDFDKCKEFISRQESQVKRKSEDDFLNI